MKDSNVIIDIDIKKFHFLSNIKPLHNEKHIILPKQFHGNEILNYNNIPPLTKDF